MSREDTVVDETATIVRDTVSVDINSYSRFCVIGR